VNYTEIIKRAWKITWEHKALWILGLFAGTTGGSTRFGQIGYRVDSQSLQGLDLSRGIAGSTVYSYADRWVPVLLGVIVLLFLFAVLWAVVSLAAQGGLVQQVNEAAERRQVRLGAGWSVGFHYWGRVAISALLLLLPLAAIGFAVAMAWVVAIVLPLAVGTTPGAASWAALAAVIALLVPVSLVAGFLLLNMYTLSLRFIVLENRTATAAISAAWWVVRHRFKDVFLMWLITVGLSLAFGVALIVPAFFLGLGVALTVLVGAWPVAVFAGLLLLVALVAASAVLGTFSSALWTLFFRRVTGREPEIAAPAYVGSAAGESPVPYRGPPPPAYPVPPGPPIAAPPIPPSAPPVPGPPSDTGSATGSSSY
jgi:hypothetical protein